MSEDPRGYLRCKCRNRAGYRKHNCPPGTKEVIACPSEAHTQDETCCAQTGDKNSTGDDNKPNDKRPSPDTRSSGDNRRAMNNPGHANGKDVLTKPAQNKLAPKLPPTKLTKIWKLVRIISERVSGNTL